MNTTPFLVDDSIPLVTLVRALASERLTVTGDRRGGFVITTPERALQFRGRDLRAACLGSSPPAPPADPKPTEAAARNLDDEFRRELELEAGHEAWLETLRVSRERHEYDEWREDDDRQRARDINEELRGVRQC